MTGRPRSFSVKGNRDEVSFNVNKGRLNQNTRRAEKHFQLTPFLAVFIVLDIKELYFAKEAAFYADISSVGWAVPTIDAE